LIVTPPLLLSKDFDDSFYRAMTVMVVASPCALIVSTPATILAAIAGAARRGVLFKGGKHLECLAAIDTLALDKTGTLTTGEMSLSQAIPFPAELGRTDLIRIAAAIEQNSEHPIARATENAAAHLKLSPLSSTEFRAIPGKGAVAKVGNDQYLVGSPSYYRSQGGQLSKIQNDHVADALEKGETTLIVAKTNNNDKRVLEPLGLLCVADTLRPSARQFITNIHRIGIKRCIMLTGDSQQSAQKIAEQISIEEVRANLLPENKLQAIETEDVVAMSSQLEQLEEAFKIARKTRRILSQNLGFALVVIALLASLALFGNLGLTVGVIGHEGSTVVVCLNALRLLRQPRAF